MFEDHFSFLYGRKTKSKWDQANLLDRKQIFCAIIFCRMSCIKNKNNKNSVRGWTAKCATFRQFRSACSDQCFPELCVTKWNRVVLVTWNSFFFFFSLCLRKKLEAPYFPDSHVRNTWPEINGNTEENVTLENGSMFGRSCSSCSAGNSYLYARISLDTGKDQSWQDKLQLGTKIAIRPRG